jgi:hypothetical protein
MNGKPLGFTTELGRDWQVWQAFRELYSNCRDEPDGVVSDYPVENDTVIVVRGEEFKNCYYNRSQVFLERKPEITLPFVEVHDVPSTHLFFRGVRVMELPKRTAFTYNLTRQMTLTEDRTLKSVYEAAYYLSRCLPMINDANFADRLLKYGDWENSSLDYADCSEASSVFLDSIERLGHSGNIAGHALRLLKKKREDAEIMKPVLVSESQERDIQKALEILKKLNVMMPRDGFTIVSSLGHNIVGLCRNNQIYLSMRCIAQGPNYIAITLYEEWIHREYDYADESRAMQQHLLDKILELVTR